MIINFKGNLFESNQEVDEKYSNGLWDLSEKVIITCTDDALDFDEKQQEIYDLFCSIFEEL